MIQLATIRDVAKKANVSVATVSRVIHGNGYVKKETKEIVEEIILETGYQRVSQRSKKYLQQLKNLIM